MDGGLAVSLFLFICWRSFSGNCSTSIKSVGKPVTHNTRPLPHGNWMKDPLGIMGADTIFVMKWYRSYIGSKVFEEFENMSMFKAGVTRKTYTLPYGWDGTGAVVYGPFLYYNRANTNKIVKYNLRTERVEVEIAVNGYTPRKSYYGWGGYSGLDLAIDEQGLWVVWGSPAPGYQLHASKIDANQNVITRTWDLNSVKMNSVANTFVACGVIYCIHHHYWKSTTINCAFDTKTGRYWNPKIPFTNQYQYNSMVDYNPAEKVLYAWDYESQVTYPITFEEH